MTLVDIVLIQGSQRLEKDLNIQDCLENPQRL